MNNFPKIVVIGGGTGIFSVLSGLKEKPVDLTAIVTMSDNGGSTGRLREEFGVLPPGDIRMALVALSDSDQSLAKLFNYRFNGNSLNHSFGNLFLLALADIKNSFSDGVKEAARILNVRGQVLPVTLDDIELVAELEDGRIIRGETNIDCPKHDSRLAIKRVFYDKACRINPDVAPALAEADLIIMGPGDLFTSIIPNLLVPGMKEALIESCSPKLYFCNLMTKAGETLGFRGEDFVQILESYLKFDFFNWIVFNASQPSPERIKKYEKEQSSPVEYSVDFFNNRQAKIIEKDVLRKEGFIRHDFEKTAEVVMDIINKI